MQFGDVVVPTRDCIAEGHDFHCGTGMYTHAIVGVVDPLVLVSSDGDMMWSTTWQSQQVQVLCQASEEIKTIVKNRLLREGRVASGS